MYDAWNACEGRWKESKFLQSVRERHGHRKRGVRKWLLSHEMDTMFGVVIAALMRERKLENQDLKAKETRFHPDLPQHEDGCARLGWLGHCLYFHSLLRSSNLFETSPDARTTVSS